VTVDVGTAIISVSDTMHGDPTPADAPVPAVEATEPALMYGKLPADGEAAAEKLPTAELPPAAWPPVRWWVQGPRLTP
jgi:2-oxoisovalerate dehydrogenase E2 component (dihydrolipoyl transacylase)